MILGAVLVWLVSGALASLVAEQKGRDPFGWFFLGVLFGPVGLLVVAVMSPIAAAELAPAPNGQAIVTVTSLADELIKLAEMHERGVLSDDEFAVAKARLLGKAEG